MRRLIKIVAEIIALVVIGSALGLVAAYFKLFEEPIAVVIFVVIVLGIIVYGISLAAKMWKEEDLHE
jgi:hypothetical protein